MPNSLIIRGAENHQTTLSGPQGGAVELSRKIFVLNTPVVSTVRLVSDNNLDLTQIYQIEGVSDFNLKLVDEVQLNGVQTSETIEQFALIERITKVGGAPLTGTVTITSGNIAIGELDPDNGSAFPETTDILNLFREVPSNPTYEKVIYEKFFFNNSGSDQITVSLREFHDPDGCVTFGLDPGVNDTSTSMNRELRPVSVPFNQFTSLPKSILLSPGQSIGVWLRARFEGGSLVTSKRYALRVAQTVGAILNGGNGNQNFGVPNNGGQPDISEDGIPQVLRLLSRHAGGLGLIAPIGLRNLHPLGGGNPLQWVELRGGKMLAELAFEPDPTTFRDQFYYNTRLNQLFRKINSSPRPVWKSAR